MSIEIVGSNPDDQRAIAEISSLAGDLCYAQGIIESRAYSVGTRAGEYAGEVVFAALRRIGAIPEEGIDTDAFIAAAREITHTSARAGSSWHRD